MQPKVDEAFKEKVKTDACPICMDELKRNGLANPQGKLQWSKYILIL